MAIATYPPNLRPPSAGAPIRPSHPGTSATTHGALAVLLGLVIAVDQGAKWWAWRHATWVPINSGGDLLVSPAVGSWFADPVRGEVLDVVSSLVLAFAVFLLGRRTRSPRFLISSGLFLAGWISNVLDRLGLHQWTAPGSSRGVVDFIQLGPQTMNVADLCIVAGAAGLGALGTARLRVARQLKPTTSWGV